MKYFLSLTLIVCFLGINQLYAQTWQALNQKGLELILKSKYKEGDSTLRKALTFIDSSKDKQDTAYARVYLSLSQAFHLLNNYDSTIKYNLMARSIYARTLGTKHSLYAQAVLLEGIEEGKMLNYEKAEALLEEVRSICSGMKNRHEYDCYTRAMSALGILNSQLGLSQKALYYMEPVKELRGEKFGKESPEYAMSCISLAKAYIKLFRYPEAKQLYEIAQPIYERTYKKDSPIYKIFCADLSRFYAFCVSDYTKGIEYAQESIRLSELFYGKKSANYAYDCSTMARIYAQNQPEKADTYFLASIEAYKVDLGKQSNDYISVLEAYATFCGHYKRNNLADSLYKIVINYETNALNHYFPILSENEKNEYMQYKSNLILPYQSFLIQNVDKSPEYISRLFDHNLFFKSIVLSSTQRTKREILESGDTSLINNYFKWKQRKQNYVNLLKLSESEQIKKGMSFRKEEFEINELEADLAQKSSSFSKNLGRAVYTWKDVQKKLKKNEVAIEIIKTYLKKEGEKDVTFFDDTIYCALLVTPQTKDRPEFLLIKNGHELENKYLSYYRNCIEFKTQDDYSYDQYWKPIADKLNSMGCRKIKKIYFSADGVYHQISLNSLQNPKTKKFLLDEQTIQLIGTSRDLLDKESQEMNLKKQQKAYKAFLLGYPVYNTEEQEQDTSKNSQRSFSLMQSAAFNFTKVSPLLGTKTEIEALQSMFKAQNIPTQTVVGLEATEESVKSLKSPSILHLATHGFFIPAPKENNMLTIKEAKSVSLLRSGFMRSGLLLSGCSNPKDSQEDGILTAEETMNLNLDGTELAVLSACETGLGEISDGEGVFGLQRALIQAGAKTLLMSLWKVDDKATQLLMTSFYKALLSGQSKQDAFETAQQKLKQKYPEPYYWGAFIMIGQ